MNTIIAAMCFAIAALCFVLGIHGWWCLMRNLFKPKPRNACVDCRWREAEEWLRFSLCVNPKMKETEFHPVAGLYEVKMRCTEKRSKHPHHCPHWEARGEGESK